MFILNVCDPFELLVACAEFREERRQLLELVGPELQAAYDDRRAVVTEERLPRGNQLECTVTAMRLIKIITDSGAQAGDETQSI
ncbi:hypothetical protein EVAR_30066_1 [Eumeta japonica]|uniref:Uncharacterized protein n=1 Tax=Eumeta variegata TaxID=151549 RepID=A0A4C1XBV3_EUMVA|nr:hypothetical protein EVAR_30066_1 [Eumeta japonica]